MSMRRFVQILPCLWALTSACGSDPTDGNGPPAPATGALELTVSTTGHDLNPNEYTLVVDDGEPTAVPANGAVTLEGISPGAHALTLADLDESCSLQEQTPFAFSVKAGVPTKVTLHVTCAFANTLAYIQDGAIYITSVDPGAVPRPISQPDPSYETLSWSPDGSTLALSAGVGVYLADADGGNVRELRDEGQYSTNFVRHTVWSPDGSSLLVEYSFLHPMLTEVYRLDLSSDAHSYGQFDSDPICGSDPVARRGSRFDPSWSPDGRHVVMYAQSYEPSGLARDPAICLFSAGGVLESVLARGAQPAWSPEGSRIAFAGVETQDGSIHTINPDGTDERDLTPSSSAVGAEQWPQWSPDGRGLSFLVPSETESSIWELWVMDADGGNRRRLAAQVGGNVRGVAWSRDGARLAFQLPTGQLAVIKRDGTGLTPVSPSGAAVYSWSWRP